MTHLTSIIKLAVVVTVLSSLSGCRAVVVEQPSNPQIMVIPDSPGPGFIYIGDSWRWNQRERSYRVSRGHWVKPRRSSVWVDGHWVQTRGGWRYAQGHWR